MKRTFEIRIPIENDFETVEEAKLDIKRIYGGVDLTIKQIHDKRTLRQNNAIHLFCELLASELNEHGLDRYQKLPTDDIDLPWNTELVKEHIWKPVQHELLGKLSTTQLLKNEVSSVYDVINRWTIEQFKIFVPFPSLEYQRTKENI